MEHEDRNQIIRHKMLKEIQDIQAFIDGQSLESLLSDTLRQKAIVMSLINIGELSKSFTERYLPLMPQIPWRDIRAFRNIAAHQYGKIIFQDVYKTIQEDIPVLQQALLQCPEHDL